MPSLGVNPWTLGLRNLASKTRNINLRGYIELARVRTSIGQRSFTFYGPIVWNSLSSALRDGRLSMNTFKWHLKSHLFKQPWTSPGADVTSFDSGAAYKRHKLLTYFLREFTYVASITTVIGLVILKREGQRSRSRVRDIFARLFSWHQGL